MTRILAVLLSLGMSGLVQADRIVHREKSLYRNIVVEDKGSRRCLAFSVKRKHRNQTCIDKHDPKRIVFPYVRMSFAGLIANPEPEQVLMIGLGGGTISNVLLELYPELKIDIVEVDPAVLKVAGEFFSFRETDRSKVHIMDGRVFTRRALQQGRRYDLIILDAYTGEYIPEHLMTVEFLQDVKGLLTPHGVVVANTFAVSRLYHHESTTYAAVFGDFFNFKLSGTGNRVIVASNKELPDEAMLENVARALAPRLVPYDVDLVSYVPRLSLEQDWRKDARQLTDQFSPANLLRGSD
jgi:spermidine synthase